MVLLDGAERVAPVRMARPLLPDDLARLVQPTRAARPQAQGHGVEEQPREAFGVLRVRPPVGDHPGRHVVRSGQQAQYLAVDRGEQRLQRQCLVPREAPQLPGELVGKHDVPGELPVVARRLVGAQHVQRRHPGPVQEATPVAPAVRRVQGPPLVADEVGGRRQRTVRHRAGVQAQKMPVVLEQFPDQSGHAAAVEQRVVETEHQLHRRRQHMDAHEVQRSALHGVPVVAPPLDVVEDLLLRLLDGAGRGARAQIDDVQAAAHRVVHDLHGLGVVHQVERGAQRRMTGRQTREGLAERRLLPGHLQRVAEHVPVDRRARVAAAVVEQSELHPGQRMGVLSARQPGPVHAGDQGERGRGGVRTGRVRLGGDPGGERRDGGVPHQVGGGEVQTALLGQAPNPEHRDRVAAQGVVVVVESHVVHAQHLGPDGGEPGLHRPLRRPPGRRSRRVLRGGQRRAVGLATGGQRDVLDAPEQRRHHELGQLPA